MLDFSSMTFQELLRPEGFLCDCGRVHKSNVKVALIGRGVIEQTAQAVRKLGCKKPFVVYDLNTYEAAGKKVGEVLEKNGIESVKMCFPTTKRLMPAEWELGSICMHFDSSCDLILGVGGGVINDLCKIIGKVTGLPTAIVGTAPSMDGYASNSGAMEVGGIKRTLYTEVPSAIICDTDIMSQAPMRMIWAGIGDVVAKYVSIFDWRISHLINGEYYCENVANVMRRAREQTVRNMKAALERDPDAIQAVVEGLVLAGVAMSFSGVSRPASGIEHCFSHIWEMMALERKKTYDLHGVQVGIGTALATETLVSLRKRLENAQSIHLENLMFDQKKWEDNVRRVFGSSAETLIEGAKKSGRNDQAARRKRAQMILENKDAILKIMDDELAPLEKIVSDMRALGIPTEPSQIGISPEDTIDAFVSSRDIRDRYLSTSLMWDLGILQEIADEMRGNLK